MSSERSLTQDKNYEFEHIKNEVNAILNNKEISYYEKCMSAYKLIDTVAKSNLQYHGYVASKFANLQNEMRQEDITYDLVRLFYDRFDRGTWLYIFFTQHSLTAEMIVTEVVRDKFNLDGTMFFNHLVAAINEKLIWNSEPNNKQLQIQYLELFLLCARNITLLTLARMIKRIFSLHENIGEFNFKDKFNFLLRVLNVYQPKSYSITEIQKNEYMQQFLFEELGLCKSIEQVALMLALVANDQSLHKLMGVNPHNLGSSIVSFFKSKSDLQFKWEIFQEKFKEACANKIFEINRGQDLESRKISQSHK